MSGINKAIIMGRLGADPVLRHTQNGQAVLSMALATSERFTDSQGQLQERTEWHRVSVWGKQAENCKKYLTKGREVYVEGKLKTSTYDKEGVTHYATDIVAQTVQFIGGQVGNGSRAPVTTRQQVAEPQFDAEEFLDEDAYPEEAEQMELGGDLPEEPLEELPQARVPARAPARQAARAPARRVPARKPARRR